jgi:class 3 adenylate cyclase
MKADRRLISTNLKANPFLLFLIWLFLLVLPIILLYKGSEMLIEENEGLLKETLKLKSLQEFQAFRNELSYAAYFEKLVGANSDIFDDSLSAADFAEKFEKKTKINPMLIIKHNSLSNKAEAHVNPDFRVSLQSIPAIVARDTMRKLGNVLNVKHGEKPELNQSFIRANTFLKNRLRFPGNINILPNKAVPFISGCESIGRFLAMYVPNQLQKNSIYGGHLILISQNQIKLQDLLSNVAQNPINREFNRGYQRINNLNDFIKGVGPEEYTFKEANDGVELWGFPSEEVFLQLATEGSFYPKNINNFDEKFIMLRVKAKKEALKHPLRNFLDQSKTPILIFFCLASIILLQRHLFGYASTLNMLAKSIISIIMATTLPFSLLIACLIFQHQYDKDLQYVEMESFAHSQANQISKTLETYIDAFESNIARVADHIEHLSQLEKVNYFAKHLKTLLSESIIIKTEEEEHVVVYNKGNQEELLIFDGENKAVNLQGEQLRPQPIFRNTDFDKRLKGVERDSQKLLHLIFKNAFKSVPMSENFNIKDWNLSLDVNPTTYAAFSENSGKLSLLDGNKSNRLYTYISVLQKEKGEAYSIKPDTMVICSLTTNDLLDGFLTANPELSRSRKTNKYKIENCFIPLEDNKEVPSTVRFKHTDGFDINRVRSMIENMASSQSNEVLHLDKGLASAIFLPKLNVILISLVTALPEAIPEVDKTIYSIVFYFLLTIVALGYFLNSFLVIPIKKLSLAAEEVKKGNLEYRTSHKSGDEFEELTQTFNEMTEGILQKEKMAKYISEEVLDEISSQQNQTLNPGGERVNAAVVFCSIGGIKNEDTANSSSQFSNGIINTLNKLMDRVDKIAREKDGQIDKLIEDTIMIVFREREDNKNYLNQALEFSVKMEEIYRQDKCHRLEIGIASGQVISGKIGSKQGKLDFTVIGNPVNLAARLRGMAHQGKETGILLCPHSIRLSKGRAKVKFLGRQSIKGRSRTFPIYELLSLREIKS